MIYSCCVCRYNTGNGAPAPEGLTDAIFDATKVGGCIRLACTPPCHLPLPQNIKEIKSLADIPEFDLDKVGTVVFEESAGERTFVFEVIDPTEDYINLMSSIFDFSKLKDFISRPDFRMVYDAMHGGKQHLSPFLAFYSLYPPSFSPTQWLAFTPKRCLAKSWVYLRIAWSTATLSR